MAVDRHMLVGSMAGVYAVQGDAFDVDYLRRWATILGVETEMEALLDGRIKPEAT